MSDQNGSGDIPEDFEVLRGELTPEDLAKLQAVQRAMNWASENRIPCTGRPGVLECPRAPYMLIVLHGMAFGVVCLDCVQPVIDAVMKAGHGSLRTEGFAGYNAKFLQDWATDRREENLKTGIFHIPPVRHG